MGIAGILQNLGISKKSKISDFEQKAETNFGS